MATRPISAEQMLAAIPSLPRPMLARLVDQMIDRMDELDGDADLDDGGDTEAVDERESDEEPRQFQILQTAALDYRARPFTGWRLSISTRNALLLMMKESR